MSLDHKQRLSQSDSTSDHSRLSLITVTPSLVETQGERVLDRREQAIRPQPHSSHPPASSDSHTRSHSLRSHASHNTSSNETHDEGSPFDTCRDISSLARSGSWASTTATSPETEVSPSHGALRRKRSAKLSTGQASTSSTGGESQRLNGLPGSIMTTGGASDGVSSGEQVASITPLASSKQARESTKSSTPGRSPNRDKPLPVPVELSITPASPRHPDSSDFAAPKPLPTLSTSPVVASPTLSESQSPSPTMPTADQTACLDEETSGDGFHRRSFRSVLSRSSRLFRSSTSSKGSTGGKEAAPTSQGPAIFLLSPALASDSSLPWHRRSSSPINSQHSSPGKSSDRSSQPDHFRTPSPALAPKPSPPLPPSRSHSPFTFRRGSSWLGGSKLDYLQERHLAAPSQSLPPDAFSSSNSSQVSSLSEEKRQVQATNGLSPSDQIDGPMMVVESSNSASMTVAAPVPSRPRFNRTRSKSLDIKEKFKRETRVQDISNAATLLPGSDSVAVGTATLIDVEYAPSTVGEEVRGSDWSRFSRLLSRKSSVATLREGNQSPPTNGKDVQQDEVTSLRCTGPREGALSRLAESLRSLKTPSTTLKASTAVIAGSDGQERQLPIGVEVEEHGCVPSSVSDPVFHSAQSTMTRREGESVRQAGLESLSAGTEAEAWWGQESKEGEKTGKGGDNGQHDGLPQLGSLKAAQLAAALTDLDDGLALKALASATSENAQSRTAALRPSAGHDLPKENKKRVFNNVAAQGGSATTTTTTTQNTATATATAAPSRRRTISFTRFMDPFRGRLIQSGADEDGDQDGMAAVPLPTGRKSTSEARMDTAPSARSHYRALSEQGSSWRESAGRPKLRQPTVTSPPSSYRAPEPMSGLTKSESDSLLVNRKTKRSPSVPLLVRPTAEVKRGVGSEAKGGVEKRKSASSASALSDNESDPLPPPRSSSVANALGQPAVKSMAIRKRAVSRPSLTIDTWTAAPAKPPARSSSALGMTADLERGAQRASAGVGAKRPGPASLNIADDLEFLQALEHVRSLHQERIKKQDEEASKVAQMARLGMASGNRRVKGGDYARGRRDVESDHSTLAHHSRIPLVRRSSSADGRYASHHPSPPRPQTPPSMPFGKAALTPSPSLTLQQAEARRARGEGAQRPSALELGVGKASGKLRDGAFINDEDWKREVKALFVIREIVLTERSYARHLEALLQTVRAMYPPSVTRKHSMSTSSHLMRSSGPVPAHITLMRSLLPQLIALSRNLANRIDENPTAAGVGAAFRLVSNQMEASFVAWSSVAKDILDALRVSERSKGKGRDRIGLITLSPLEHASPSSRVDGFVSVPNSPTSALSPNRILADSPEQHPIVDSPTSTTTTTVENTPLVPTSAATKRRSTLTGISPSFAAHLRGRANGGTAIAAADAPSRSSPPQSQSLGRRAIGAVVSSSRPPLLPKAKTLTAEESEGLGTMANMAARETLSVKRLSALDVAIMPTQRIPRYLLLLRDLNANTPPQSLSHIRLQRSLDYVRKVAGKCDRASKSVSSR